MGTQYGPYVMYILSQLMQKRQAMEQGAEPGQTQSEAGGGPGPEETLAPAPRLQDGEAAGARQAESAAPPGQCFFAQDETAAVWHKETNLELLKHFCREGYAQASRHGHFLIGNNEGGSFIAIPGRFLLEDQPAGGRTGFTLWQPLRGGEALFDDLENMDEETARQIYGYWIAALDGKNLEISEV